MTSDTITVGGLPGTGTSTLCRALRRRLDMPYVYAGQLFRDEAEQRGLSLAEFGRLCESDPSIDRALDDKQLTLLQQGGIILEGRLAGWLAHTHQVPAFKVWLTCSAQERIRRIVERDGGDPDGQMRKTLERENSEADRYARYYGADVGDLAPYDLVLDSTGQKPDELADAVVAALRTV